MKQSSESSSIPWHPAFVEAIILELDDYRDSLEFFPEYQLTSEPLRIDCLVIKKTPDIVIKKNIASIFREANLLEYKSPYDYISVPDFYKVYGYACLYSSFENVPVTNMTISFVESRYPRELLAHLQKTRGYRIEETSSGIYTVEGDILPIQIIDSRKLSEEENLWLRDLSNELSAPDIEKITTAIYRTFGSRQGKEARILAYFNAIAKANITAIEEATNMSKPAKTLEEVLERTGGYARAEARGKEYMALDIAENLAHLGVPLETVISATKLDPEKVKAMYKN
jgi:hypothetical protein